MQTVLLFPRTVSFFQCLYRKRFSAPAGRSWIDTVSGIFPPLSSPLHFLFIYLKRMFFGFFGQYAVIERPVNIRVREAERLLFKLFDNILSFLPIRLRQEKVSARSFSRARRIACQHRLRNMYRQCGYFLQIPGIPMTYAS